MLFFFSFVPAVGDVTKEQPMGFVVTLTRTGRHLGTDSPVIAGCPSFLVGVIHLYEPKRDNPKFRSTTLPERAPFLSDGRDGNKFPKTTTDKLNEAGFLRPALMMTPMYKSNKKSTPRKIKTTVTPLQPSCLS